MVKVLFIDDCAAQRDSYRRAFRDRYEAITAESAEDAAHLLSEIKDIAVIVTDYAMPRINGAQFLKLAAAKAPESARIMLTGAAISPARIAAETGVVIDAFLQKPCDLLELTLAIERSLHGRAAALETV